MFPYFPKVNSAKNLVLYEIYHSRNAWRKLYTVSPFRGISVVPGVVKPYTNDIDCPSLYPLLQNETFQNSLCEYGAIFTVNNHLENLQGQVPYLGFQSWKAKKKKLNLSWLAIDSIEFHIDFEGEKNIFYYWATWNNTDMWDFCDKIHKTCREVYSTTFWQLFANPKEYILDISEIDVNNTKDFLPELPRVDRGYALCSYWVMHIDYFKRFVEFAKVFFVTAEATWDTHGDISHCPLKFIGNRENKMGPQRCWCYLLENLVNIWVYYSGMQMVWVNRTTGEMEYQLQLEEKTKWSHLFSESQMKEFISNFPKRLSPEMADFYDRL